MERLCIVIPVYNDWESVERLLVDLALVGRKDGLAYHIVLVDDSSTTSAPTHWEGLDGPVIQRLRIVRLACNLGHQRAIAVGLVVAKDDATDCSAIVVMDGDGEDRPKDVPRLLEYSTQKPGAIVCARRARRSEPLGFRMFYGLYKLAFAQLTGVRIDFGNFCLVPNTRLTAVISQPGTWNHLAATLTRSRMPLVRVETDRGVRYAGTSKMNLVSLIVHGLSAVAVYSDIALVRVLLFTVTSGSLALLGLVIAVGVRFLTDLAIPGWATTVAGTMLVLFFQAMTTSAIDVFVVLTMRTSRAVIPAIDALDFVASIDVVSPQKVES